MNKPAQFKDYFTYVASVSNLAPAASLSTTINLEADSKFVAVKMSYMADIAGGAQTDSSRVIPLVKIFIQDSGSGRFLQSLPVDITSIAGRGELPFILPIERLFYPNSTVQFTFTNYSAGTTYANVSLSLIGYKIIN